MNCRTSAGRVVIEEVIDWETAATINFADGGRTLDPVRRTRQPEGHHHRQEGARSAISRTDADRKSCQHQVYRTCTSSGQRLATRPQTAGWRMGFDPCGSTGMKRWSCAGTSWGGRPIITRCSPANTDWSGPSPGAADPSSSGRVWNRSRTWIWHPVPWTQRTPSPRRTRCTRSGDDRRRLRLKIMTTGCAYRRDRRTVCR